MNETDIYIAALLWNPSQSRNWDHTELPATLHVHPKRNEPHLDIYIPRTEAPVPIYRPRKQGWTAGLADRLSVFLEQSLIQVLTSVAPIRKFADTPIPIFLVGNIGRYDPIPI